MNILAVEQTTPVMANLEELSSKLKALNQESDQVNKILLDFEAKINAMNPGLEAWVVDGSKVLNSRNYKENKKRYSLDTHLGFGKHGDKYCLLFKEITYVWEPNLLTGGSDWEQIDENLPRPLLQAPRDFRIKALELMEDLIDAIKDKAEKTLGSIEKGREVVDNL